jgi:hypothetical protein
MCGSILYSGSTLDIIHGQLFELLKQRSVTGVPRDTDVPQQGFRCAASFYKKLYIRKL